jgi:hypothetical protein
VWGSSVYEEEVFTGDYCWDSGAVKMFNIETNKLVPDKNSIIVNKISDSDKFNEKNEQACVDEANKAFLAKLPKFPKAMLERMKVEDDKKAVSVASTKFYTWKVGVRSSATSHTAWGHRRNGGGKSGVAGGIIFKKMNSDTAVTDRSNAKRVRRIANKEKSEAENVRHAEIMKRIVTQQSVVEAVEVTEPIIESVSSISQMVMSKLRSQTEQHDYEITTPVTVKVSGGEWTKVDKKQTKNSKSAMDFVRALYENQPSELEKIFDKKPMSKNVASTLMCSSVANNVKCTHNQDGKCNFAHCAEELKPRVCANKCCNLVKQMGGKFVNRGFKVCAYIHEGETKTNLCNRIGVKVQEAKVVPVVVVLKTITYTTPISTRVMKPFSATRVWAPVDYSAPVRKSRWGAKKSRWDR